MRRGTRWADWIDEGAAAIPITGTAPDDATPATVPSVMVIGAAVLDVRGRVTADRVYEGSSNAGQLNVSAGGVARNIAENLARLDVDTALLAAVADDLLGDIVTERTRAAGVNTRYVFAVPDARTGAYLGIQTPEGDLLMGIDDMAVVRHITPRVVRRARYALWDAGMVVLDANLPGRTIRAARRLCDARRVPVCIEPVSLPLIRRIVPYLPGTALFTPNIAEAEEVLGCHIESVEDAHAAALALREWNIGIVVITLGGGGAVYATGEGTGYVPAIQTEMIDAGGAGSAMTAGIICGLMNRFPIDEAVGIGASVASLTVQSLETVRSDISLERVYDHLVV